MTKEKIFTSAGAALLAAGLVFSGPPTARASEHRAQAGPPTAPRIAQQREAQANPQLATVPR